MKSKVNRLPVFLQIVAHRERWRRRTGAFASFGRDLRAIMSPPKVSNAAVPDLHMGSRESEAATES